MKWQSLELPQGFPKGLGEAECRGLQVAPGVRIRVVGIGPRDALPVLCLHGWACSVFSWRHLLPALAANGCRAWAMDFPGHGGSSKPEHVSAYTADAFVHVVRRVMDETGMGKAAMLVAHSMGAPVAVRLTGEGRAERLALLAPIGVVPVPMLSVARLATPEVLTPWLPRLLPWFTPRVVLRLAVARGSYAALGSAVADAYWVPSADPRFVHALRHLLHDFDWRTLPGSAWRAAGVPTSVLLGGADRFVPARATVARLALVAPDADVQVVERCGHVIPEEAPARVLDLARALLRRAPSA